MAATGSDAGRDHRRGPRALLRRLSLRLRLTLLYGACFLLGSGAVLAVTYLLVAHQTDGQNRDLHVQTAHIQLPGVPKSVVAASRAGGGSASSDTHKTPTTIEEIFSHGTEIITLTPSRSHASTAGSALRHAACLRAHGVPDFPNPGPNGNEPISQPHGKYVVEGHVLSEGTHVLDTAIGKCEKYSPFAPEPRYSPAQLAKIKAGALAMANCMRAHGVPNYPDPRVVTDADGRGFALTAPGNLGHHRLNAAYHKCMPLLNRSVPGAGTKRPQLTRIASSIQKQVNGIVNRANGALTAQRSRSLASLLTWSCVALGVMAALSILLGWLLAGRSLRPLRKMTSRARWITEENLHERLAVDAGEDELGELATTFDGVLARLERAFDAQKRFVANASHELRTPVTLERALLELALADPDAGADMLRRTCERVLASTKQQHQMIEALLTLARSQSGTDVDVPVDLADLAQDAIELREQRLNGITVAADLHRAPLTGDPALLDRLVANLIDNAIIHNRADDAWITVETGHEEAGSWLCVSNSGPQVPEPMITEIFEPFRRVDGERTATTTGVGLGLSIVRAIADVHGAATEARPLEGGGLRVHVRF